MDIRSSLQFIMAGKSAQFSERFYANFFRHHPQIENLFAGIDQDKQGVKLVKAIQVMVQNYLRPHPGLENTLRHLGYLHSTYGASVEDYVAFEVSLISTLGVMHGPKWNDEIAHQWRKAFQQAVVLMKEGYSKDYVPEK